MASSARYRGVFPVAPTTFDEAGGLDLASQKRCIDFMIDAGSQGICILANFSEQFVLADDEREQLARTIIEHIAGQGKATIDAMRNAFHIACKMGRAYRDNAPVTLAAA